MRGTLMSAAADSRQRLRLSDSAQDFHSQYIAKGSAGVQPQRGGSLPPRPPAVQKSVKVAPEQRRAVSTYASSMSAAEPSPEGGEGAHPGPSCEESGAAAPRRAAAWEARTQQLVASSVLPFLLLLLPQLLKNHLNLAAGNGAALSALSWLVRRSGPRWGGGGALLRRCGSSARSTAVLDLRDPSQYDSLLWLTTAAAPALQNTQGYLTGLGGNTLLLSYFTQRREGSAVLVQAIGIASSFAVLTQVRAAGFMPRWAYAGVSLVVAAAATLTGLQLSGRLSSKPGQAVWATWQKLLGLAGLAVVPQVRCTPAEGRWRRPRMAASLGQQAVGASLLAAPGLRLPSPAWLLTFWPPRRPCRAAPRRCSVPRSAARAPCPRPSPWLRGARPWRSTARGGCRPG